MAYKLFLDANAVLDFTLQRDVGFDAVKKIVEEIIVGNFRGFTTPAVIHMSGYWLTKEYSAKQAKAALISFIHDIKIIDCSHEIAVNALYSPLLDIEDALQYYTALHHKMDFFISRDKLLIKSCRPELPVFHPSDFVKKFID